MLYNMNYDCVYKTTPCRMTSKISKILEIFLEINTPTFYSWIMDSFLQFLNYVSLINRSGFSLH